MASLNLLQKTSWVGLDFGSSSLKLVQLVKREGRWVLVKTDSIEVPSSAGHESKEDLLPALKELLKDIDIKKSDFIVSVNCPQTALRIITIPSMPKAEMRESIRMEAQNFFPFAIHEAGLDFEILGEVFEDGVKKIRVCVGTSPRKTVDASLSLLRKVGIKPLSIVPVAYALQKLSQFASDVSNETVHGLFDIGYQYTEGVIFKGKEPIFCRKIPVAGRDFTKALMVALVSGQGLTELSLAQAEKVKREVGIPLQQEYEILENKFSTGQILSMLRAPLEQLSDEMDRCLHYYREETGGGAVDFLTLTGGGAFLKGLVSALSENLGLEVRLGYPLKGLTVDRQVERSEGLHHHAVALGAALSFGEGINLLPPELKEVTKRTFKRATVQSVAVSVLLIAAFIFVGMRLQLTSFQKRIDAAHLELSSLQPQLEEAEKESLAREILASEPYWDDVFKDLSNITGESLYLTQLAMTDQAIRIKGRIFSGEKEGVLSSFIMNLESGVLKDVRLVTSREIPDQGVSEFELRGWVD